MFSQLWGSAWMTLLFGAGLMLLAYFGGKLQMKSERDSKKMGLKETDVISITDTLPYKLKDSVLTPPEYLFYKALKPVTDGRVIVFTKVGLKDFLFIGKDTKEYMKYLGRISQKHIDFLLCHPETLRPICGIELDDSSHDNPKTRERDAFIEKVYKDANFPLVRYKTKPGYTYDDVAIPLAQYISPNELRANKETMLCPKCNVPMVLRTSRKSGNQFYGCKNYPNCRETMQY